MAVFLGPVTFTEREIPDTIPFGGRQSLAIHKNLGGQRTVDAMGPDPAPIRWSGLFFGPTASERARLCDGLKDTGAEVRLAWGSFNYLVVISDFHAVYKHEWEVHYHIAVEISTTEETTPIGPLEQIIQQDWTSALAVPGLSSAITGAISTAQTAIGNVAAAQPYGSLSNASLASLQPAITSAEAAYEAVDGELTTTENSILGINMDAAQGNSVIDGFNAFMSEASNAAYAANLRVARAYIGRIVGNLTTLGG